MLEDTFSVVREGIGNMCVTVNCECIIYVDLYSGEPTMETITIQRRLQPSPRRRQPLMPFWTETRASFSFSPQPNCAPILSPSHAILTL